MDFSYLLNSFQQSSFLQAQWKRASGVSFLQLSGSFAAPWTRAPVQVQRRWAWAGRTVGTTLRSSGGWVCRLWEAAPVPNPQSPPWSERRVGSDTCSPCFISVALCLTSWPRMRWRRLCVPWQSGARCANKKLETWWRDPAKELWAVWRSWRSRWEWSKTSCSGETVYSLIEYF